MDIQTLVEKIGELTKILGKAEITSEQLDELVSLTNQLNERAIIIRYKSFEEKVFDKPVDFKKLANEDFQNKEESISIEVESAVEEPIEKVEEINQEILDTKEQEIETSFDLFSFDTPNDEEYKEEKKEEVKEITEIEKKEEPVVDSVKPISEIFAEKKETILEKVQEELKVELPVKSILESKSEDKTLDSSSGELHAIYQKINYNDNSLAARLNNVGIETLQGAFSLSESMQIINELFAGSHDRFSDALKELNNLEGRNEARVRVSKYAVEFSWNSSSEIALAFVQKIDRRYP